MRVVARILLYIYVPLVALALVITFLDAPTGRGYDGLIGVISAFIVGLPWSIVVGSLYEWTGFGNRFGSKEDAVLMWLFLGGSGINLWLLGRWAFRDQGRVAEPESYGK